jgi:hypothetical protein
MITRRHVLILAGAALVAAPAQAIEPVQVTVYKDPACGCCGAWADHIRNAGYKVTVIDEPEINPLKGRLGVPSSLMSCHTAEVGTYVLEGHVPAAALARLLAEKPEIRGLAVPGMPVGSPGMEVEGTEPEIYDVMAFGSGEPKSFMRFKGGSPL